MSDTYVINTVFKAHDQISSTVDRVSSRMGIFGRIADHNFKKASAGALHFKSILGGTLVSNLITSGLNQLRLGVSAVTEEIISFDSAVTKAGSKFGFRKGTIEFTKLQEAARKTGETTIYSATEAAKALNEMAGAGKSLEESMALLPKLTTFGIAGDFEDMGEAMKLNSQIMAALGISSKNAEEYSKNFEHIGEVMAKTDIIGLTSVQELGTSLLNVSPAVAKGADSIESLAAMLNVMASAGLRGEVAGTDLAFAFRRLTMGIPKVRSELNKYNISIEKGGKMRSMIDIAEQLHKKLGKLSDFKKQQVLTAIFGAWGSKAMMPIMNNLDAVRGSLDKIKNSAGASMELASMKSESFENRIKGIKSRLFELGLKVFDVFEKDIYGAFDIVEQWLKDFDGKKFKQWIIEVKNEVKPLVEEFIKLIKTGGELASWLSSNGVTLVGAAKAFVAWKVAVLGLNIALATTQKSLGALVAAKGFGLIKSAAAAMGVVGGGIALAGGAAAYGVGSNLLKGQEEANARMAEMKRRERIKRITSISERSFNTGDKALDLLNKQKYKETGIVPESMQQLFSDMGRAPAMPSIPAEKSVIEVEIKSPFETETRVKQGKNAPIVRANKKTAPAISSNLGRQ